MERKIEITSGEARIQIAAEEAGIKYGAARPKCVKIGAWGYQLSILADDAREMARIAQERQGQMTCSYLFSDSPATLEANPDGAIIKFLGCKSKPMQIEINRSAIDLFCAAMNYAAE